MYVLQHFSIGKRRLEGYLKALNKHSIPVEESLILKCNISEMIFMKNQIKKYTAARKVDDAEEATNNTSGTSVPLFPTTLAPSTDTIVLP